MTKTVAIPGQETAFEQDVLAYVRALPALLNTSEGKYALVGHGSVAKVFDTRVDAMSEGYRRFGQSGFLVQEVSKHELEKATHWHRL